MTLTTPASSAAPNRPVNSGQIKKLGTASFNRTSFERGVKDERRLVSNEVEQRTGRQCRVLTSAAFSRPVQGSCSSNPCAIRSEYQQRLSTLPCEIWFGSCWRGRKMDKIGGRESRSSRLDSLSANARRSRGMAASRCEPSRLCGCRLAAANMVRMRRNFVFRSD